MKKCSGFSAALLVVFLSQMVWAQERAGQPGSQPHGGAPQHEQGVGGGHIPQHGPAPAPARPAPRPKQNPHPEGEQRKTFQDAPGHPPAPHVHAENDRWIGHDTGKADVHYHLDHPWEHGHFTGTLGPQAYLAAAWRQSRPLRCRRIFLPGCALRLRCLRRLVVGQRRHRDL